MVVTRPRSRAAGLTAALHAAGASVVEFPTIRIDGPEDDAPLREALARLSEYDWIVFTSVNGVERFFRALAAMRCGPGVLRGRSVAAIGPATRRALRREGIEPDIVPGRYRAEELVEAILAGAAGSVPGGAVSDASSVGGHAAARPPMEGVRVLIPRAAEARSILPDGLRRAGAEVDVVTAYRTVPTSPDVARLRRALEKGEVDWVTFTASSTVRHFVRLVGREIGRARVAVIGPITGETSRRLGLAVSVTATEYTIPGLVEALVAAGTEPRREAR